MGTAARHLFLMLALVTAAAAAQPSLLAFELRSLDRPERRSLETFEGAPVVMLFFQPGCSWCLRQVRAIHRVAARCPGSFQSLAVGVNGDRRELKAELRRLRPGFPAFEASPQLLEAIGGAPATPFALLGDSRGRFSGWLRGYVEADRLAREIPGLAETCDAAAELGDSDPNR